MRDLHKVSVKDVISGVTAIVSERCVVIVGPCLTELCFSAVRSVFGVWVVIDEEIVDVLLCHCDFCGRSGGVCASEASSADVFRDAEVGLCDLSACRESEEDEGGGVCGDFFL